MRTILELFFFSNKKAPVCSQTDRDDCSRYHPAFRFLSSKIKLTPESNSHFECNVFHGFCYSFSQKQLRRENSIGKTERTFSLGPSLWAIFSPFVLCAIFAFQPTVYCLNTEKSSLLLILRLFQSILLTEVFLLPLRIILKLFLLRLRLSLRLFLLKFCLLS